MTTTLACLNLDPFDEVFLADPYAHHAAIREVGRVVWLDSFGAFGMAHYEDVQQALRDHETYCSARGVGLADFAKEEPFLPLRCCSRPIRPCTTGPDQ